MFSTFDYNKACTEEIAYKAGSSAPFIEGFRVKLKFYYKFQGLKILFVKVVNSPYKESLLYRRWIKSLKR